MSVKPRKTSKPQELDFKSANLVMRAEMMAVITDVIRENGWTQGQAAEILGVGQPRISDVFKGHVDRFSVDMLMVWLQKLGKDVSISIKENVFSASEKVDLSLFVCGTASDQLLSNVAGLFGRNTEKYSLTVIDILQNPNIAYKEKIASTPCLIKNSPLPRIVLTGDMSAASVRWQLDNATRLAQEERQTQQEVRQKEQDQRQELQDERNKFLDYRERAIDKRQKKIDGR